MTATDSNARPVPPQTPEASGSFMVGDVLVSSGGWEQTNISFYQVVAVTPKTVVIRALQSRITARVGEAQQMNEPIIDSFIGGPVRRAVKRRGTDLHVMPTSFKVAVRWDGKARMSTHYA